MPIEAAKLQVSVESNVLKVEGEVRQLGKTVDDTGKNSKQSLTPLYDGFKNIQGQILTATGVVAGFGVAATQAFELGKAGAGVERMEMASASLASSMGGDMKKIISAVREASLGTVSDLSIMQSSSRAMMLGLGTDAEKLANLMEVAGFRGRAMGLSTEQAFNDIVTGVGRMSPMILDNLGIVLDAEGTYKAYAESLGKTAEQLTSVEKRQALLNRVLEEGNKQIQAARGNAADALTPFEQFDADIKNIGNDIKVAFADPARAVAVGVHAVVSGQDLINSALEEHKTNVTLTAGSYEEYVKEMIRAGQVAGKLKDYGTVAYYQDEAGAIDYAKRTLGLLTDQEFTNAHAGAVYQETQQRLTEMFRERMQATADVMAMEEQLAVVTGNLTTLQAGLVDAQNDLVGAQKSWAEGTGNDVARQLEQSGVGADEYKKGLDAIDEVYGTTLGIQQQYKDDLALLVSEYKKTGDVEAFKTKLDELKDSYMPLNEQVREATDNVWRLRQQIAQLESKKISIEVEISQVTGATKTSTTKPKGYQDPAAGEEGIGGASGLDIMVPPGNPNDTFPVRASSGERVIILTPEQQRGFIGTGERMVFEVSQKVDVEFVARRAAQIIRERR